MLSSDNWIYVLFYLIIHSSYEIINIIIIASIDIEDLKWFGTIKASSNNNNNTVWLENHSL